MDYAITEVILDSLSLDDIKKNSEQWKKIKTHALNRIIKDNYKNEMHTCMIRLSSTLSRNELQYLDSSFGLTEYNIYDGFKEGPLLFLLSSNMNSINNVVNSILSNKILSVDNK